MRLGIFGGSFDPVHDGHLALARACQDQGKLDEVWFTPTAIQPLKHTGPHASDSQRVEMLNLAIEYESKEQSEPGHPRPLTTWRVCTLEIDRGGFSYTVDTLRQIHIELPDAKLFFLMGSDILRDVPNWKEPSEIFRLATPMIVSRAGETLPEDSLKELLALARHKPELIEMPAMPISSSDIRRYVAGGKPIDGVVPDAVSDLIAKHGLYL